MKKPFLLLSLLLISAASFAQTKLADEFPAIMKARNADPEGYLRAHTTPDMVFIAGHDGSMQNKDWLLSLFKGQKSHHTDITNLKIQQSGDLAVATGISTIAIETTEGKSQSYKDAFTYTLRWLNNNGSTAQWMLTNMQHTKLEYK